jgi:RNA polymerase sigma-70 factor (ECF subfamily)
MLDERELIGKVLAGSLGAFEALIRQYERLVYAVVWRIVHSEADAEDISQEVFIKVHRHLSRFRFQSKLSTWIARIAYTTALNHLKRSRQGRQQVGLESAAAQLAALHEPPAWEAQDLHAHMHRLIGELPVPYRTVLTLYHLEEFSYEEIGAVTGMPAGTVKSYLFRARKLLRAKLEPIINPESHA